MKIGKPYISPLQGAATGSLWTGHRRLAARNRRIFPLEQEVAG